MCCCSSSYTGGCKECVRLDLGVSVGVGCGGSVCFRVYRSQSGKL